MMAPCALGASASAHLVSVIAGLSGGPGAGLLHGVASPHAEAAQLALLAAGALWTRVEFPLPAARRLRTSIVYAALIALGPLCAAAFALGLSQPRSAAGPWLAAVVLVALSSVSAIAAARAWGGLAPGIFGRKRVLVIGNAYDLLGMRAPLAPGHLPDLALAGVVPPGDRSVLAGNNVRRQGIWAIVATDEAMRADPELSSRCRRDRIRVFSEAEFRERWRGRVDIDHPQVARLAGARSPGSPLVTGLMRRSADILLSTLLLISALPLGALAAACIKCDSRGPLFSTEERVGLEGRRFRLVMFRSRRVSVGPGPAGGAAGVAGPEPTRAGRLLRRTRIDALPELWNVLRGDMSLVGPRPERPSLAARSVSGLSLYNCRTLVKPGIIGWAQVNCGYGTPVQDARQELAYDLYYLKYRNLALDLHILCRAVRAILFGKSAR